MCAGSLPNASFLVVNWDMDDEPTSRRRTPAAKKQPKSSPKATKPVSIRPAVKKIGEGDHNLERRAEWFRRRTTDDENQG